LLRQISSLIIFPRNLSPNFWLYIRDDQKGLNRMADLTDSDKSHFIDKVVAALNENKTDLTAAV